MITFSDAFQMTKNVRLRNDVSPNRRMSRIDLNLVDEMFNQGATLSIFDIIELLSKQSINRALDLRILERLKPTHMINDSLSSCNS